MSKTLLIATIAINSALIPFIANAEETTTTTTTAPVSGATAPTTTPTQPAAATTTPTTTTTTTTPTSTTTEVTKPTETSNSTDMTKDAWLSQMSPILPDVVCKGFIADTELKKRFDVKQITYEKCIGMIPAISSKCQGQIYAQIPAMINDQNASTWGRTLGECIGKNFAEQYLIN